MLMLPPVRCWRVRAPTRLSVDSKRVFFGVTSATTCLLRSIYRTDDVTEAIVAKSVPEHVKAAFSMPFVVPLALLLAKQPALLVADALRAVAVEPVLRNLMASTAVAAGDH